MVFLFDSPFPYRTGGREGWLQEICKRLSSKFDISIVGFRGWDKGKAPLDYTTTTDK